ncbi:cytochrome P450 [Fomes fomentarius]|nr:cytochrome P450 [Fomes fomentarius]
MDSVGNITSVLATISFALLAVAYIHSLVSWRMRSRGRPLPPGPKPLLFFGNLFNSPSSQFKLWVAYRDLCTKYGVILHFRVMGQSIVVLGSSDVIFEYLDQRSSNTSDRRLSATMKLTGNDGTIGVYPYGTRWRQNRRAFWQHFAPRAAIQYQPVQRAMAHKFLLKLLQDPSRLIDHIRLGSVLCARRKDARPQSVAPGKFLVERFPFLRYVPSWVPDAGFQKQFAEWRVLIKALRDMPFKHMKRNMIDGDECISSRILTDSNVKLCTEEEREDMAKNVALTSFQGGSDTTYSITQAAILALSLYPDALKKAQSELNAVVGPNRMTDFSDFDSLVYLQALIKEAMRWHNPVPLGLPHATTADDELHGFFIPAGTLLLPNIWACMHDPEVYENPDEFRPERFLKDGRINSDMRDPAKYIFGFGRRLCPGQHYGEVGLFITLASLIHVFDITPPLDEYGRPIRIVYDTTDGLLAYPKDCRCTITPRSLVTEALILAHAGEADAGSGAK